MTGIILAAAVTGSLLTLDQVKDYAASCQHLVPSEWIVALAEGESQVGPGVFDPNAMHLNRNGSRDIGLMQINSSNLSWLGLSEDALRDPCINVAAAAAVLAQFSSYNSGSPTKSPAYARAAWKRLRDDTAGVTQSVPATPAAPNSVLSYDDRPASAGGETFFAK